MASEPSEQETKKLFKLVQKNTVLHVQKFLAKHKVHWSVIRHSKTGDNLLHLAAKLNYVDLIEFLLTNFEPKCVDCRNNDDKTPLHFAAQFGRFEACERLLHHGADVNVLKRADWTPLMLACTKVDSDSAKVVELLLDESVKDFKNKDGWTCLHLTVREGDPNILKLLIDSDVDLTMKTNNGRTALHIAALHGRKQCLEMLLNSNLNINETDNCGNTPLHEAVLANNIEICEILLQNGANPSLKNNNGYSLIHLAACEGNLNVLNFLVNELECNVNESNDNGNTPLHCAARKNQKEAFEFLLSNGADQNAKDNFQRTPSDYFCESSSNMNSI